MATDSVRNEKPKYFNRIADVLRAYREGTIDLDTPVEVEDLNRRRRES